MIKRFPIPVSRTRMRKGFPRRVLLILSALALSACVTGCAGTGTGTDATSASAGVATPEPSPTATPEPTATPFILPYFGASVPEDAASVTVDVAVTESELEQILLAVQQLPNLTELVFTEPCVPLDWAKDFRETYPGITLCRNVSFFGKTLPDTGATLTFEGSSPTADELIAALAPFDSVAAVELTDAGYTEEELLRLRAAYPDMPFKFTVTLLGQEYPSDVTAIDLRGTKIKTAQMDELYAKLGLFTCLETVDMCECGPSNEEMDALNKAFPNTRIVWMIRLRGAKTWKVRTDAKTFSTALASNPKKQLWSRDVQPLIYCTDLEGLDLGHNEVRDLSFLHYLPKLKYLILVGCGISDISPLAELKDLQYLEIFSNDISDISPLAGLTNLVDLNFGNCDVTDLSPLYGLKNLRRCWCSRNFFPEEQKEEIQQMLPDCTFDFLAFSPTGNGWRKHENFYAMREFFGLGIID